MVTMSELWVERQIQILVLLSFILQVFLFFTGGNRRHSTNTFLRFSLWIVYLAADSVAIYVLGLLHQQQDAPTTGGRLGEVHPLAFIWAPFLLIHLGGQDTITAFSMDDNNLWLRHLLNLVLQVSLALYVFWKSAVWHNVHLVVTGIFLFLAGMLKYGERTMALKCSTLESLESFAADDNKLPPQETIYGSHGVYRHVVRTALNLVVGVRDIFGGCTADQINGVHKVALDRFHEIGSLDLSLKLLELELSLIYDDLYTKALVLRTRTGITVRCISQASIVVALVLFLVLPDKQRYSKADVTITYTLFLGGIFIDVCATFMMFMSAWTWGWLVARKYRWLAGMSWWLLSSKVGLPEKRTLWSNSMGQYDLFLYSGLYDGISMSWKQQVMKKIRWTVNFGGVGKGALFWFSKLLDTTAVTVDKDIMEFVSQEVHRYKSGAQKDLAPISGVILCLNMFFHRDFAGTVLFMHLFTAVHLSKYISSHASSDMDANPARVDKKIELCRKLSNYMLYIFITHPELLPANDSAEAQLEHFYRGNLNIPGNDSSEILINQSSVLIQRKWRVSEVRPCEESLDGILTIWIRLIMYMAGKSRPEMHAAYLIKGGELISFVWLLMLHNQLGDSGRVRIELCRNKYNFAFVYNTQVPPA